ncbi:NTF2-like protein [Wolfiporia cocos MD-104 SS10]|uniref:NTF2-like protein n=1 Tax=Wolfiporia cocos (strain MD-104) TaxID=742152 RepID=A0A2H3JL85_WOLCO|nr:NTF2-like protein [Wolfiporia cocos MD-104 SS10]
MSSAATSSSRGRVASSALRGAGLVDRDERMRDASDRPGGRKGSTKSSHSHKTRSSHRPRAIDSLMGRDQVSTSSRTAMLASRLAAGDSIAIRGAAKGPLGRLRRNAVSDSSDTLRGDGSVVDLWKEFINKRWNAEAQFLNLERIAEDEFVKRHRLAVSASRGGSGKELAVMFKLASVLSPEVQTVSLANNNISNGSVLSRLSHYLPKVLNLSLEGNKISQWRDLDCIAGKRTKLQNLRELILTGNPICETEYQHDRDRYKSEIARRFPTLEMLDMEAMPRISFDAPQASTSSAPSVLPEATSFPVEMCPPFITGVDGAIIGNFFTRFFPAFDTQRLILLDVYQPDATFSFSVNTSVPPRARLVGYHTSKEMPNQRKLDWNAYLLNENGGSRNLSRMGNDLDGLTKTLHVGREAAVKAMADLPNTKHDIAGSAEKFCVDAWPVQQGDATQLFVTVHGQFVEEPSQGIRSFDRSFILAPAPDGSRAKQNGWDVVILSDQLTVRAYSGHDAWRPGPMRVNRKDPGTPVRPPPVVQTAQDQAQLQEALASIPEPQKSMVIQICHRTGLNIQFGVQCLESNGWDIERAITNFEQVKGTLTRDAFL